METTLIAQQLSALSRYVREPQPKERKPYVRQAAKREARQILAEVEA